MIRKTLLLCLLSLLPVFVIAQTDRATLTGTIIDPSGSRVARQQHAAHTAKSHPVFVQRCETNLSTEIVHNAVDNPAARAPSP